MTVQMLSEPANRPSTPTTSRTVDPVVTCWCGQALDLSVRSCCPRCGVCRPRG